jgi:hypothetical protein
MLLIRCSLRVVFKSYRPNRAGNLMASDDDEDDENDEDDEDDDEMDEEDGEDDGPPTKKGKAAIMAMDDGEDEDEDEDDEVCSREITQFGFTSIP